MIACRLFGLGETDSAIAQVIDAVPFPEESIAQNGQGPHGLGEVHAHEGANAGTLDFENVVIRANGEVVASQCHGKVGQRVALRAVDSVLAVPRLRGTNLLVAECLSGMTILRISIKHIFDLQELRKSRRQGNQGSASVKDGASVIQLSHTVTKCDSIKVYLPVGLTTEGNFDEVASVVLLVNTTKGSLGIVALLVGVAEIESEHRLIEQLLVQHVVERGDDPVDRDGVKAQTQDAVETAKGESQTGLARRLSEVLFLDREIANTDGILRDKARQAARPVADAEFRAVLLVGGRRRRIVLVVQVAGDGTALRRWHPQVGTASVKDDLEGLRRGANGDFREVC